MKSLAQPHVVYIITKLELGGAQKVCLSLIEGLQKQSSSSCSLISGSQGPLIASTKAFNSVYLLDSMQREVGIGFKKIFNEVTTFISLIKILKKIKNQFPHVVVHTHSTKAGILGRWAAFFCNIKTRIHTVHGYGFHDYQSSIAWSVIFLLEYITSLITTHFVCVSNHDRVIGIKLFPKFEAKSSIIRAAVQDEKFYPSIRDTKNCTNEKEIIIGTISCFKPQKNLLDLLQAFYFVRSNLTKPLQKKIRLQIIGDGIARPELEAWIVQHKLGTHVDLLGWQNDVAQWMKNWHIFALSSLWEGLPCAIIEAQLCGIPVVAYNVGGINEVIKDAINGFVVEPKNWKMLGEKIIEAIDLQENSNNLRSHDGTLDLFKNSAMIASHIKLYDNFVAHHQSFS